MKPVVDRLAETFNGRANVITFDVNEQSSVEVAKRFKVMAVPTMVFFDKSGQVSEQLVGAQDAGSLDAKLKALLQ